MSIEQPLQVRRERELALLALDDGRVNAITPALVGGLLAALDGLEADPEVRALVLAGRSGCFCAGFDLAVMRAGPEPRYALTLAGAELALRLFEYPKPVVIACSGHALAMGAILLFTADWRTGAAGAFRIALNEVRIGMVLPQFAAELARQRLNPGWFTRAVLNAEILAPESALAAGWLDETVVPEELLATAGVRARDLGQLDARAFAATKQALRAPLAAALRAGLPADLARFSRFAATDP